MATVVLVSPFSLAPATNAPAVVAAATGAGHNTGGSSAAPARVASGTTGTANNAAVSTPTSVSAPANEATATGAMQAAAGAIIGRVGVATGAGSAPNAGYLGMFVSGIRSDGVDTATSARTPIAATGHATPFTNGTYTQIDASLSADAAGIYIKLNSTTATSATNTSTVLELATGAAASEVAWATVGVGYLQSSEVFYVPGFIAAGTRVAVRVRSAVANKAVTALYQFVTAPGAGPSAPVVMGGASIATTARGVTLTAPVSLNTKGAWTEIVASTSATFGNLLASFQAAAGTNMAGSGVLVDIGVGAAASETVLIGDIHLLAGSAETYLYYAPTTYGVSIPIGSRLSARYQRASSQNALDVILVGA